jgi:hypothetical protein
MDASSPHQAPDPFYGVQLWTIRRQKIEGKALSMLDSPFLMHLGMMISGIIRNYHYSAVRFSAFQPEVSKEAQERLGIKACLLSLENEFTIAQPHRPKVADAAMGRMMQDYRVPSLWRHPHAATRTMLLKTNFIDGP